MRKIMQKNGSFFAVEVDREEDGRWIVEIPKIPGAMAYGATKREALQRVYAIALSHRQTYKPYARAIIDTELPLGIKEFYPRTTP